jgi:hypothetical protein
LVSTARQAAGAGSARKCVILDGEQRRVVGCHAITAARIERGAATARALKGRPRCPVPVVLLARLAVDVSVSSRGIGASLLRDAMLRTLAAADTVGVRALVVHALDDDARALYLHHGVGPSPTDPLHLMVLLKEIAAHTAAGAHPGPPGVDG